MISNFKVKRIRNPKHLTFVRTLPCCNCGRTDIIHAHHIRMGSVCGTGLKPNDSECVPLCDMCHSTLHFNGEEAFWDGRNPHILANSIYRCFIDYGVWDRKSVALMAIRKWKCNGKKNIHTDE